MRNRHERFVTSVLVCLVAALPARADTIGYWRFEPGALLKDSSRQTRDLSAVGGGVTPAACVAPEHVPLTGETNRGGAAFTGNGALRVPSDGADVTALKDGQDFTFECWLCTGKRVGTSVILSKVRDDPEAKGTRSHGFDFLTIGGRDRGPAVGLYFRIYTRQDGLINVLVVADAIAPETVYHLALSRREKTYRIFINGELRAEGDCNDTVFSGGDIFIGALGIGDRLYGGHVVPAGTRIDEARLSDRALLPNEFLLFPRSGQIVGRVDLQSVKPLMAEGALREYALPVMPGVYDVRLQFRETDAGVAQTGRRMLDVAINGRQVLTKFDIRSEAKGPDRSVVREFKGFACPDGRLRVAMLSRAGLPPPSVRVEIISAVGTLDRVMRPAEVKPGSGWELPFPNVGSLIPDAIKLTVSTSREPQAPGPLRYVPSQALAPFPERLNLRTRSVVQGIADLAPDFQQPIDGGVRFLKGTSGRFEIHHRRAGAQCGATPVFRLRMEKFGNLAAIGLGVKVDDRFVRLDQFECKSCEIQPGRMVYDLQHAELKLSAEVEAVAPAAVPAYGVLARIALRDLSGKARRAEIVALAAAGTKLPPLPEGKPSGEPFLCIDTPRGAPVCDARRKNSPPLLLHDTDYDVLVGLDGEGHRLGDCAVVRTLQLPANGQAHAYLTALIDSPGSDEAAVGARIREYFDRNKNLPEDVRRQMTEDALDTLARIVVQGDRNFEAIRNDGGAAFDACCRAWQNGVYRREPVTFELPDKKLESLANLVANDHFAGIVQPPGLVHDAKGGDHWNYIFCYRHVHAACDIGLEPIALGYMRLLSANQQKDGRIASVRINFKTLGHGTRFDASYIDALHHYYRWTGDLDAVRQLWPTITRAAEHIDASLDPDGDHLYLDIIHQWKSDFDNRGPSSSFQTAIVRKAYADLAELAALLGKGEEAKRYRKKAEQIRQAAQAQLWSDEFAMLGPKGPLGILRLHPQSLEVEMPVWTKLVDPYQAVMLTDWYLTNVSFRDRDAGLWMYDNDWWPVVWSQHMGSPGDYMMVGWALMLTGQYDDGCNTLRTVAGGSYRHRSPGFNYTFDEHGVHGGNDPATAQGAFFRALVEGVFGVEPQLGRKRIVLQPRFPSDWTHAAFRRAGLNMEWRREGGTPRLRVRTRPDVRAAVRLSVDGPVKRVTVDGQEAAFQVEPSMRHALVCVDTKPGGGEVCVESDAKAWEIDAPSKSRPGEVVTVALKGIDAYDVEDRFRLFEIVSKTPDKLQLKPTREACGRAAIFLRCRTGNIEWIEPVIMSTRPATAKDVQQRTVADPPPAGTRYVPVDLSAAYNDDIQTCFRHRWKWDAYATPSGLISYWTMPLFTLRHPLPRRVRVGRVPFLLGPMGPGEAEKQPDLLMLANTPPRELPTSATVDVGGRRLHKIYLLSLNMNLPQKCYVPAA